MNQAGNWFANRGQVIQACFAGIACIFAGVKAWPDIKANLVFSGGALLFYSLVGFVIIAIARVGLLIVQSRKAPTVDHAKLERVSAELSSLSRFELFAVRHLCAVEGMTGEQFYTIVEQLGFPVATRPTQNEIIATFERIAAKTPLVVRSAGPSPRWSIQSEARLYAKALADQHSPIFGF